MRRTATLVLLLAASACRGGGPAPSTSPTQAAPLTAEQVAGCYAVHLRRNGATHEWLGNLAFYQPPRLRLSTAPARSSTGFPLDGYRVEAAAGDTMPEAIRLPSWRLNSGEMVHLNWSTGFSGMTLILRTTGDDLTGPITLWDDGDIDGFTAGDAVLERIPCE